MITLRRAQERRHDRRRKREVWLTFFPQDRADPLPDGFGALENLSEDHLPPGAGVPSRRHHHAEVVTYARNGALAYEDSRGRVGVILAGEFQCMTTSPAISHREANASTTDWAHVFRIFLRPWEVGLDGAREQKRFTAAQRRNVLCVVASPDGRRGSLRIHQDASIYSSMLDAGQHVVHQLLQGRSAWLHLVQGEVTFGDSVLATGDAAGVTAERAVSLTAREETEILLLDLAGPRPGAPKNGSVP
jgi:redox-sensitive bicupin YhaK (pirin superfamily)